MKRSVIIYTIMLAIGMVNHLSAQEPLRREVKLYNPFKPTLSWENKLNFFPEIKDTASIVPEFRYSITPRVFMPEYNVTAIGAARLEPDPLNKLYKGFLNLGFGNYFSPLAELSISTERSRDKLAGLYASHNSSFGKVTLANDESVYAGYMDNDLTLYATKLFRRSSMGGDISFSHLRRYAYGYDPEFTPFPSTDHDSLKIDYLNPSASLSYYGTRIDSSHLSFNADAGYDLFMQNSEFYQHNVAADLGFGYNFKPFYGQLEVGYRLVMSSASLLLDPMHLVSLEPSIGKRTGSWAFKAGLKAITFSSDITSDGPVPEYETRFYLHPDVRFQFDIIPSFATFFVALDGELEENRAATVAALNPFVVKDDSVLGIVPSRELYSIRPTDNRLRVSGGLLGSAGEKNSYRLLAMYTLFDDMLLFTSDTLIGRSFTPIYDNGEMLQVSADFAFPISDKISLDGGANYYYYKLEQEEKPWYKPVWDAKLSFTYNLRNKIIANASLYGVSERFGKHGPMSYTGDTDPVTTELPVHVSLNIGLEYRYTEILTFWTRLNNISNNRYFEYSFYPAQRFLFQAGFTYSM